MTPVKREQLPACLEILRNSYEATAVRFGMTEENCPYRGRTRLPLSELEREYDEGAWMVGYLVDGELVGFLSLQQEGRTLHIQDLAIVPERQSRGYGSALLRYAEARAVERGCEKLSLGMVHDHEALRGWYEHQGFSTVQVRCFEKVRYGVGLMEKGIS